MVGDGYAEIPDENSVGRETGWEKISIEPGDLVSQCSGSRRQGTFDEVPAMVCRLTLSGLKPVDL
jgi:hypothetical protein